MAIICTLTSYLKPEPITQLHQCERMRSGGEQKKVSEGSGYSMQCCVSRTRTTVSCKAQAKCNNEGEHRISPEEKNYHLCGFCNKAPQ